jgi:hypothetical protein
VLLPLDTVLKRGVVFLYPRFPHLADPSLAGQTKPKYLVIVSSSPLDDPILYLLTTSRKPQHASSAFRDDFVSVAAGKYPFLPQETIINCAEAGVLVFDRGDLEALYRAGELVYQGVLQEDDVRALMAAIQGSRRVPNRIKQILSP